MKLSTLSVILLCSSLASLPVALRAQSCSIDEPKTLTPTFESKTGTATLVGFSEFTSPSSPPKVYRKWTKSGSITKGVFTGNQCQVGGTTSGGLTAPTYNWEYQQVPKSSSASLSWSLVDPWTLRITVTCSSSLGTPLARVWISTNNYGATSMSDWSNGTHDINLGDYANTMPVTVVVQAGRDFFGKAFGAASETGILADTYYEVSHLDDFWDLSQEYVQTTHPDGSITVDLQPLVNNSVRTLNGTVQSGGPSENDYTGYVNNQLTATKRSVAGTGQCTLSATNPSRWTKVQGTLIAQLSVEDTEDDAAARATGTKGSSNTAYHTARGNSFTFGFTSVHYKIPLDRGCACGGQADFFLTYSVKPHGAVGPITTKVEQISRYLDGTQQLLEGDIVVSQPDTDYTLAKVEYRKPCANQETGAVQARIDSLHLSFGMGRTSGGVATAGTLLLDAETLTTSLFSPAALTLATAASSPLEVIRDASSNLRQIKGADAIADIVTLTSAAYEIRFYPLASLGAQDPASHIYSLNGSPFVTYKVENPDVNQTTRLRLTETRGTMSKVTEFSYAAATNTWTLSQGDGLRQESEVITTVNGDTVKTKTVRNNLGEIASVTARTYHVYPWGEELVREVLDPSGAALTTTYEFYSTVATSDPNYRHLKQLTRADGSWERYSYDASGRTLKTLRPFLDAAPSTTDESQCRVTEVSFDTLADADGDGISEDRVTTVERTLGTETGRRYQVDWSKKLTFAGDVRKRRSDIICTAAGATWNDPANLVTETLSYTSDTFLNRARRVSNPDGTGTLTTYVLTGGQLTTTTKTGQLNGAADAILDGRQTVTVTNVSGRVVSESVSDIASGLELSAWAATETDSLGRPTRLDYTDGTYVTRTYACCGLSAERDRSGLVTTYTYDALGRQSMVSRSGVTMRTAYDADGRVKSVTRIGTDASEIVQETNTYDVAGRLTSRADAMNRSTSYNETFNASTGRTTRTTTNPANPGDGGTVTEVFARDGSRLGVSGTAVAPHAYAYGMDSTGPDANRLYVVDTALGFDANGQPTVETEWVKSYSDFVGRPYKTLFADGSYAESEYNAKGQLKRQTDPDGVSTLFAYNGRGERDVTAVDIATPGAINYDGVDRVAKTATDVVAKTEGGTYTVLRTTTQIWETDNVDAGTVASVVEQSSDGSRVWQTVRGLTTKSVTTFDGTGGRTVTTTTPDGVKTIQSYAGDRLISTTVKTAADVQLAATTNAYDAHGRLASSTDARNGATTFTYFSDDQIHTVNTPDPDPAQSGGGYDAQMTTYAYDGNGRVSSVTQPDGGVVVTTYYPTGQTKRVSGARTYPVEYTYDAQGRVKTLTTWQDFAGDTGKAVTTWNYDAARGWLSNKHYADGTGPSYTYYPSGRLQSRVWARTPTATTYTYNAAGDLATTDYHSAITPNVTITYDRTGRPNSVTDGSGARTFSYHSSGQLQDETYTSGLLNGFAVSRTFDALQRLSTLGGSSLPTNTYAYDAASRLSSITTGANVATYGYVANSPLVGSITFTNAGTGRLTTTKTYDNLNRLSAISSQPSSSGLPPIAYSYSYNAANQRTRVTREDNAFWNYGYDALGQVTSGKKYLASNAAVLGHDFAWTFDDIGNRKTSTVNGAIASYNANTLNEYTQRTVPGVIDVLGAAKPDATVTLLKDGAPQPVTRQGELFYQQLSVPNATSAQYPQISISGVKNNAGANGEDAATEITQNAFLPRTPETFTHDADGNLTSDARWLYTWDAENRLIAMETQVGAVVPNGPIPPTDRRKLEFTYDAQSRRVAKKISAWNGSGWTTLSDTRFLYDGWNLLGEFNLVLGTSNVVLQRSYVWGLDLSGAAQGAGGVGGLISVTDSATGATHFAAFDGNGNVGALIQATDGTLSAKYDYNPFGETIMIEGAFADANPFRFSTKFTDVETGYLYYGYRYYAPDVGRWLSRDPDEEKWEINLLGFCFNAPSVFFDGNGLAPTQERQSVTITVGGTTILSYEGEANGFTMGIKGLQGAEPNRAFGADDFATKEIARSRVMEMNRTYIRKLLSAFCVAGGRGPVNNIPLSRGLADLGTIEYPFYQFPKDLLTNSTAAFVGSFTRGDARIIHIDCSKCEADIHIHGENDATLASASHLPPRTGIFAPLRWVTSGSDYAGSTSLFPNGYKQIIADIVHFKKPTYPGSVFPNNPFGANGPFHSFTQTFDWDEHINFGPCCGTGR